MNPELAKRRIYGVTCVTCGWQGVNIDLYERDEETGKWLCRNCGLTDIVPEKELGVAKEKQK